MAREIFAAVRHAVNCYIYGYFIILIVQAIGGNIITASPISDLNPLLLAAGCLITVASYSMLLQVLFLLSYCSFLHSYFTLWAYFYTALIVFGRRCMLCLFVQCSIKLIGDAIVLVE